MEIRYLKTSELGFRWFRTYYRKNPQLNIRKAVSSLENAESVLGLNPEAGKRFEAYEEVREYTILGTAFSLLYTIFNDTIWVIDICDQRGFRSAEALRKFNRELRESHGVGESVKFR